MNKPFARILILALLLIAAWVLWSGYLKPLLLGLGALSCVLTIWVVRRMGYFDDDTFAFHYDWRLLGFWAWLGREVVLSSIEVARVVLSRKVDVAPKVVDIDGSGLGPVDLALLGNSITLTPGTLTLDVYEGRLLVHALTPEGAAALEGGEMQRRVAALRKR
jgi:multicomponent Na+:H+ antiporter subunit E